MNQAPVNAPPREEYGTVLGADANFKGEFTFDQAAKIMGRFEGSITSKGKVHVGDGATCKATITAQDLIIEGRVEGNVQVSERIDLKPNARITGDIIASRMSMNDGATIDGHVRIGTEIPAGAMHPGTPGMRSMSTTEMKPGMPNQHQHVVREHVHAGGRR